MSLAPHACGHGAPVTRRHSDGSFAFLFNLEVHCMQGPSWRTIVLHTRLSFVTDAGKLAGLGLLIQGGTATGAFPAWDLSRLRYFGVLQRIAVCFLLVSLVVLYLPQTPDPRLQVFPLQDARVISSACRHLCKGCVQAEGLPCRRSGVQTQHVPMRA